MLVLGLLPVGLSSHSAFDRKIISAFIPFGMIGEITATIPANPTHYLVVFFNSQM